MLLPLYRNGTFQKWSASLGLWFYDFIAGVEKKERRVMLSPKQALVAEPLLNPDKLTGAGMYYEYSTDDARLVIDILKTAAELDAVCFNYCRVHAFILENEKVAGVKFNDVFTGNEFEVKGTVVVNASGPWVDTLVRLDDRKRKRMLFHTKGVHIVVARERLPVKQSAYFDGIDGRLVFAIAHGNKTYIGTTDTTYTKDLAHPDITQEDVQYLISAASARFPNAKLDLSDVESAWAGIRPLIMEEGKKPSEISRRDEVLVSAHGLITIAGGKLTGC